MDRSAQTALPSSYSKTFPAFGAGAAVTHAAGPGRKRFIDFIEPHTCVSALIPKHGWKRTPPRIEHGFCLFSLCKGRSIHIADKNCTVSLHQARAELLQKIFPPVRDPGVNRPGAISLSRPLSFSKPRLQVAIEALGFDRIHVHIAKGRELSQTKINADARNRSIQNRFHRGLFSLASRSGSTRHADIQIPAASGIFAEVTGTQFKAVKTITIPEREPASREVDLARVVSDGSDLERNPPERAAHAAAPTPSELNFPMLAAAARVFFGDLLDRLHGQIQGALPAGGALQIRPKIKARQEAAFALEYLDRQFVAVIKGRVDLASQRRQPRRMLVLDPQAQDPNRGRLMEAVHMYSLSILSLENTRETALKALKRVPLSPAGLNGGVSREELR
jgi:hypothetical protein